jgi:phosphoribosylformylglycinamidine (FGAM) synthase-like amidotransferase family enzyme
MKYENQCFQFFNAEPTHSCHTVLSEENTDTKLTKRFNFSSIQTLSLSHREGAVLFQISRNLYKQISDLYKFRQTLIKEMNH